MIASTIVNVDTKKKDGRGGTGDFRGGKVKGKGRG